MDGIQTIQAHTPPIIGSSKGDKGANGTNGSPGGKGGLKCYCVNIERRKW